MDDGSRLRVVPNGTLGDITNMLAVGWYQVIFPSGHRVRVLLHARRLTEVKPPPADKA